MSRSRREEPCLRCIVPTKNAFFPVLLGLSVLCCSPLTAQQAGSFPSNPTYYKDVLPIVQEHCQVCHRNGGIGPMEFQTYEGTRAYASAIQAATQNHSMP